MLGGKDAVQVSSEEKGMLDRWVERCYLSVHLWYAFDWFVSVSCVCCCCCCCCVCVCV